MCLLAAGFSLSARDLPKIVKNKNGVKQLVLDNKPYVMLAGELMNSSASTLESMALEVAAAERPQSEHRSACSGLGATGT